MSLKITGKYYEIDGKKSFFISGEIPMFRVSDAETEDRMRKLKDAGANVVATYVPWLLNEPEEGKIVFDDVDFRNITHYLDTAAKVGLKVVLRPGPLQYSELIGDGLPLWLLAKDELLAKDIDGKSFNQTGASYLHPLFLDYTRKYFKEFVRVIRPFLAHNGGPVIMLQADNEVPGIHLWYGSMDFNPVTMGFGTENGRYPTFLRNKFGTIDKLNAAYKTAYKSFAEARPKDYFVNGESGARAEKDYIDFYCGTISEYMRVLEQMLRDEGVEEPVCHNISGWRWVPYFDETRREADENFLLGVDNYFSLNFFTPQNNITPQHFTRFLMAADLLDYYGYPPTILEFQAGTYADTPVMSKEAFEPFFMSSLAAGYKGFNYYTFAGGDNVWNSGITCDVYDYNAPVAADGTTRPTYEAIKEFNAFMHSHEFLAGAEREYSFCIGTEPFLLREQQVFGKADLKESQWHCVRVENCLNYAALSSRYAGKNILLSGDLDLSRPLAVIGAQNMSRDAQTKLIDFVEKGGKLFILGELPSLDENFEPCTLLSDYIGKIEYEPYSPFAPLTVAGDLRVYQTRFCKVMTSIPKGARVFATDGDDKKTEAFYLPKGKGGVLYMCGVWQFNEFSQARLLEKALALLGAKSTPYSTNRSVYVTSFTSAGKRGAFVLNLYLAKQNTELVYTSGGEEKRVSLALEPFEVRFVEL